MKKPTNIVESSDIWMKMNGQLEEDKEQNLKNWLDESSKHQAYFNQAKEFYQSKSVFEKKTIDSEKLFHQLKKKNKRKKRVRLIQIAASIFVIISLSFTGYLLTELFKENPTAIHPGSSKAILVLNDGKTVHLEDNKPLKMIQGKTLLKSENGNISYNLKTKKTPRKVLRNTLKVPIGGEFFITLSDGTKVWINSDSQLNYPVSFHKNRRIVELKGEAFFEVHPDKNRPFFVKSQGQLIKVLGTKFNLSAYSDDQLIKTTLVEGKVEVALKDLPNLKKILSPSEQAIYNIQNKTIETRIVDTDLYTSWKNGQYFFINESLEEIFRVLSRWYDFNIEFKDQQNKEIKFTGSLNRNMELAVILDIIERTQNLKIEVDGKKLTVN